MRAQVPAPAATTAAPTRSGPLRILALHGGGGNAAEMEYEMRALRNALGADNVEFVYGTGPYGSPDGDAFRLWIRDPPGGKGQATTDPDWALLSYQAPQPTPLDTTYGT